MANKPHKQEHLRQKAIKNAMKQPAIVFAESEETMVKSELLPFILTHFFPKEKQREIRRFLHTLRGETKKREKKHTKRTDSLYAHGTYRDEHAFHKTNEKIKHNRDDSARAKAKRRSS